MAFEFKDIIDVFNIKTFILRKFNVNFTELSVLLIMEKITMETRDENIMFKDIQQRLLTNKYWIHQTLNSLVKKEYIIKFKFKKSLPSYTLSMQGKFLLNRIRRVKSKIRKTLNEDILRLL